jgi:hypothetical protein
VRFINNLEIEDEKSFFVNGCIGSETKLLNLTRKTQINKKISLNSENLNRRFIKLSISNKIINIIASDKNVIITIISVPS